MFEGTPDNQEPVIDEVPHQTILTEIAPERSTYALAREERVKKLWTIASSADHALYEHEQTTGTHALMPENLVRDEMANSAIQYRTMIEVDEVYEKAKTAFGRELTAQEEEILLVALDYIFKRIISADVTKEAGNNPERIKQYYFNAVHLQLNRVLPGDLDLVVAHDLVHIVLALKQGEENLNSPIPTFMRESTDFNTGPQAMLEEAFATMFTNAEVGEGASYDDFFKNPKHLQKLAESIFDEKQTPLYRGMTMGEHPHFTDAEMGAQAKSMINAFLERNKAQLEGTDTLAHLALFSQGAAFGETLGSDMFEQLSPDEKLKFIQEHLAVTQQNIDVLISGEIPDDKDEKYKMTALLTRESFAQSMQQITQQPDKPVFVELLLQTLLPLYAKAKAQADATFERLEGNNLTDGKNYT